MRVGENDSNGIRNAVAGILQSMVAAAKRRIAFFDAAGGCRDGKILQNERSEACAADVVTPKTSNVQALVRNMLHWPQSSFQLMQHCLQGLSLLH